MVIISPHSPMSNPHKQIPQLLKLNYVWGMRFLVLLMMCLSLPLMGDEADMKKFEEAKVKAEKGDADAQYQVGVMYRDGKTVNADLKQAFRHFKKSANQGHVMAQYELGILHLHGKGAKRDAIAAFTWLNIAGANGSRMAAEALGKFPERLTNDQISKADALAREMIKKNPKLLKVEKNQE